MTMFRIVGGTDLTPEKSQTESRRDLTASGRISFRAPDDAHTLTITNRNKRLRKQRKDVWHAADATVNYWDARIRFEDAIEIARSHGVPDACRHPPKTHVDRIPLLKNYRAALVEQLLAPAPDIASINWKQAVLDKDDYVFVECVEKGRVEKVIADDLAFLRAHPTRRPRGAPRSSSPPRA
jgi:hypothetical protein